MQIVRQVHGHLKAQALVKRKQVGSGFVKILRPSELTRICGCTVIYGGRSFQGNCNSVGKGWCGRGGLR